GRAFGLRTGRPSETLLTYLNLLRVGDNLEKPLQKVDNLTPTELLMGAVSKSEETNKRTIKPETAMAIAVSMLNLAFVPILLLPPSATVQVDDKQLIDPLIHFEGRLSWRKGTVSIQEYFH
ncbi:hypothetical protein PMAYCL1PPCAC_14648, partial [Pristionchus mayeri]